MGANHGGLISGVLLIVIQGIAFSQQPQTAADRERDAICEQVACRPAVTLRLKVSEKEFVEFNFPKGPYVAEGFINILNGEEFNVEFEDQGGKLINPHYVKEVTHSERTINLKLGQLESGTVLTIRNPFSQQIIYDCAIQHFQQQKFTRTSVIPVRSNLLSFESWPYPITQLVISNVRYQSARTN